MLTAEQLEIRRKHVGASEWSTIFGLNPYQNAADLALEKRFGLKPDGGSDSTRAGDLLERPVLEWFTVTTGRPLRSAQEFVVNADLPLFSATMDSLLADCNDEAAEAKTCGVVGPTPDKDRWGEAGTGEVPEWVYCQAQAQCFVAGLARVWVPALIGGRGFQLFIVQRDTDFIGPAVERIVAWHKRHVIDGDPVTDARPNLDVLKRVRRESDKRIVIPDTLYDEVVTARDARLAAEKVETAAQERLLYALGDAEVGVTAETARKVTYLEYTQNRKATEAKVITFRSLKFPKS
ncbi:MAG: YqaJ viral recombinase family protein [Gemmatimonadota bacterium]